jgi:hypothetical protein
VVADDSDARDEATGHRWPMTKGKRSRRAKQTAAIGTLSPTHRGREKIAGKHAYFRHLLAGLPRVASAQVNCEAIPHGPARTDCYLGLSQFYRGQSGLAAARAQRNQTPRGIEQLPEQTLRNTNHIGDDKSSDYSRAGSEKLRSCAPNFRLDLT